MIFDLSFGQLIFRHNHIRIQQAFTQISVILDALMEYFAIPEVHVSDRDLSASKMTAPATIISARSGFSPGK